MEDETLNLGLLASFVVPFVLGLALVDACGLRRGGALLRGSLALGLGAAATSLVFFGCATLFGLAPLPLIAAEAIVMSIAVFVARRAHGADLDAAASMPATPRWLWGAVVLLCVAAGVTFVTLAAREPHGDGDALGIWNLRAIFLFRAWGEWGAVFNGDFLAHTDYPLLVPLLVTRAWVYAGGETVLAPIAIGGLFAYASVGGLLALVRSVRPGALAPLATIALLGTPYFFYQAAAQTADVPLAFYVLVAVATIAVHRVTGRTAILALGGFAAGCAAWTKNEGVLFAALWFTAVLIEHRRALRLALPVALVGAALPLLALGLFKACLAGNNDLLAQSGTGAWQQLTDLSRYRVYGLEFGKRLVWLTEEGRLPGCSYAVLAVLMLFVGRARCAVVPWSAVAVLVLMVLGDFLVFVALSQSNAVWHARTAVARLLLQMWPAAVFVVFASMRDPFQRDEGAA